MATVPLHLARCPACAALFAAEEALERSIQALLTRPDGDEEQVIERALSRVLAERAPFSGPRLAFAAAVLLLVQVSLAVRLLWNDIDAVPALVAMAADDRRRYLAGDLQPEVSTARRAR